MKLLRLTYVAALVAATSGCATLTYPLPKCDGYSKRPLNRSMWDWNGERGSSHQIGAAGSSDLVDLKLGAALAEHAITASLDVARSHRTCGTA